MTGPMRYATLSVFACCLVLAGCGPRIDKAESLTVKLREGFSVKLREGFSAKHGAYRPGSFEQRPIKFEYGEWTYTPQEKPKAKNTKEQFKDDVDSIGESILGQIFVTLAEVVVKGTVELAAAGIQASVVALGDDEVVVSVGNEVGKISLIAEEGFNRVALTASDRAILERPWTLEIWSMRKHRYALAVSEVPVELFAEHRFIEILLADDGSVSINGRVFDKLQPLK